MQFAEELALVLPSDLPNRDAVIAACARHLEMIVEANEYMNLTRITTPREAAIKHVLDSVTPWRLFAGAKRVMDAGTGPGFPGIALAATLPEVQFTLAESTQKKARFVEAAVTALGLMNVDVAAARAEDVLAKEWTDIVTARAVAPLVKAIFLFAPAVKQGARVLLYKGPDAELEMAEAAADAANRRVRMNAVMRYELPDQMGTRTMVELTRYDLARKSS